MEIVPVPSGETVNPVLPFGVNPESEVFTELYVIVDSWLISPSVKSSLKL